MKYKLSEQINKLSIELQNFGLTNDESIIYLELTAKGQQSALALSRITHLSRTKVYEVCDKLITKGLITKLGQRYSTEYKANPPQQLDTILNQKKLELSLMESNLGGIYDSLASLSNPNQLSKNIIRYEGIDGLRQVTWNTTKATGLLRVFELATMDTFLDFDFCERVRIEYGRRGLKESRQLTNLNKINPWTNIEEFVNIWQCRYIDPKDIQLQMEIVIYNDVVAMYQYKEKSIFCVEIYNKDLAETQKQFYDFIWNQAKAMKILNPQGETILP
jgi:hypothetical protein